MGGMPIGGIPMGGVMGAGWAGPPGVGIAGRLLGGETPGCPTERAVNKIIEFMVIPDSGVTKPLDDYRSRPVREPRVGGKD